MIRVMRRGDPVVSVDTKKKELVGDFRNGGREWRPAGEPEKVRVHDFKDAALGKAVPYDHRQWADDPRRTGRERIPQGRQGDRRADGSAVSRQGQVPRRLELHDFANRKTQRFRDCLFCLESLLL